jgi:hypothetical protein
MAPIIYLRLVVPCHALPFKAFQGFSRLFKAFQGLSRRPQLPFDACVASSLTCYDKSLAI